MSTYTTPAELALMVPALLALEHADAAYPVCGEANACASCAGHYAAWHDMQAELAEI